MFINFSNHPSALWNAEQIQAAKAYGEIQDVPFPAVPADASEDEVLQIAEEYVELIVGFHPEIVMCQGEFSLAIAVIVGLKKRGIRSVCACSERQAVEQKLEDGSTRKEVVFAFRKFREYKF